MSAEHEAFARRIYAILETGSYDRLPEVLTEDYVEHQVLPGSTKTGYAAVTEAVEAYRVAFPDLHFEPTRVISEGDQVACHFVFTGTHTGDLMGMPATGRSVRVEGVDIARMSADGRCAEHWGYLDESGLMAQLGVIPGQATGDLDIDITERTAAPA